MKLRLVFGALVSVVFLLAGSDQALAEHTNQKFFINSPNGTTTTTVIAVGAFNGVGEDISVTESFEGGNGGRFTFTATDKLLFDEGKLVLRIQGGGRASFNGETCSGTTTGSVTYKVVRGTGLFRNAEGSGSGTFDFAEAGKKVNGECVEDDASGVFFAKLKGTLALAGVVAV